MHALHHRAVLRRHQAGGLRAGEAKRVDGSRGVEAQPARRACGSGEHAERRARMPALLDVPRTHAQPDARADLVARHGGGEKLLAAEIAAHLGDGQERGQHDRADVQHAGAVHVVELEALHLRAVGERRVRRREAVRRAPYAAGLGVVNTQ